MPNSGQGKSIWAKGLVKATLGSLCHLLQLNEEKILSETEVHTFLKVLLQMVHLKIYVYMHSYNLMCSFSDWVEANTIFCRISTASGEDHLPWWPANKNLSRAGLLGQGLILYLAVCFRIVDSADVWNENTEENKTVENARQVVKLAGNNVDSVNLILNGRFWRNADVIREITEVDGDFYRSYEVGFWIVLRGLQVDGLRSSVWF